MMSSFSRTSSPMTRTFLVLTISVMITWKLCLLQVCTKMYNRQLNWILQMKMSLVPMMMSQWLQLLIKQCLLINLKQRMTTNYKRIKILSTMLRNKTCSQSSMLIWLKYLVSANQM
eukprot:NODE_34_length_31639_cov_0.254375.p22 type:complete len:116 gc:universal NODE_34_length_31639_cov_0.254375:17684-17337(-)